MFTQRAHALACIISGQQWSTEQRSISYCDLTPERRNCVARERAVARQWLCKHVSTATRSRDRRHR
jgi:hypothetical protein